MAGIDPSLIDQAITLQGLTGPLHDLAKKKERKRRKSITAVFFTQWWEWWEWWVGWVR